MAVDSPRIILLGLVLEVYRLGRVLEVPRKGFSHYHEWRRDLPAGKIILEESKMSRWDWFTLDEFTCKCGCDRNEMEPAFIDKLDLLRAVLGFPLIVSSGFRCPEYNDKVSNTGLGGPHTTGRAVDFLISGGRAHKLLSEALDVIGDHQFTGIGINQKGPHMKRFIHLDDLQIGQRPWIWSY